MAEPLNEPPLLLRVQEVAHLTALSTRTIRRLSTAGEFPKPVSLGSAKRWRRAEVTEFVNGQERA